MRRRITRLAVALVCSPVLACTPAFAGREDTPPPPDNRDETTDPQVQDAAPLPLRISISGVMIGLVHDAASPVFRHARSGHPLNEGQWREIMVGAINLIGAASLVSMEGAGDRDAARAASPDWRIWAKELQTEGVALARVAQNRDQAGLAEVSQTIFTTCQSCHAQFAPSVVADPLQLQ